MLKTSGVLSRAPSSSAAEVLRSLRQVEVPRWAAMDRVQRRGWGAFGIAEKLGWRFHRRPKRSPGFAFLFVLMTVLGLFFFFFL